MILVNVVVIRYKFMNAEILARIQFAFTIAFHYVYPPLTIGLGLILVIMEGLWLKTRNPLYHSMARFWTRIFALIFVIGVVSGIVMEFEFGTNWATYSRFVGDIFGSALAAEGIFAFFLESGFLTLLLFGWDKVGPFMHFFATCMVCLGSHFSAVWIVIANSWMQTPAGFRIEVNGEPVSPDYQLRPEDIQVSRAVIDDFWAMIFNPSSMDRLLHVLLGCWLAGAFLVISVSAFYILKKKHLEMAYASLKIALVVAMIAAFAQLLSGDATAKGVARNQPVKLAAIEGIFDTQKEAPLGLVGWVDLKNEKTHALKIPGLLSFLAYGDKEATVQGLKMFPKDEWPKVAAVFQTYHIMIAMGTAIIAIAVVSCFLWWRGLLFNTSKKYVRMFLWILVFSVLLPQIANQAGWFTAELGRQPWIVYGLLKTSQGLSEMVTANQVLFSLIMFTLIYFLLFCLFIFLLHRDIQHGPRYYERSKKGDADWRTMTRRE